MKNSIAFPNLLRCPILRDMSEEQKAAFLDQCALRRYPAPAEVLAQGAPAPGMFLVAQGQVEVSYCDPDGNVTIIHTCHPGDILGEVESISANLCAATCTARADTVLLFCPTPLLFGQIQSVIFVRNLVGIFYGRLTRENRSRSLSQYNSVEQRLCLYLCQFSTPAKRQITVNQSYLANVVGCSRQTMNRKLGELRDDGIIALGKGMIQVLDRPRLEARIDDPRDPAGK